MRPDELALPDAALRMRVGGSKSAEEFVAVGRRVADDVERALASIGRPLSEARALLDFGCGCGRVARWLAAPGRELNGCDVDAEAVAWCRAHLPFGTFFVSGARPPIDAPDARYDLVLAISVFSHFDEAQEAAWLDELARVTRPGGVVAASVITDWSPLAPDERALRAAGFAHFPRDELRAALPYSHTATYHTRGHVLARWTRRFAVRAYLPRALNEDQDLVLLEKRT